jgi:hypothetical protein
MPKTENPLESLHGALVTSSQDWGEAGDFAWIYGIVVGWDPDPGDQPDADEAFAMADLAQQHGWTPAEVARLRRLHAQYEALRAGVGELSQPDRAVVDRVHSGLSPEQVAVLREIHTSQLADLRPKHAATGRAIAMREASLARLAEMDT